MRSYGSMKSNYLALKKGFTLYMSVIKHPVFMAQVCFNGKQNLVKRAVNVWMKWVHYYENRQFEKKSYILALEDATPYECLSMYVHT